MAAPIHTPYDGSSKPFQIGLQRLDLAEWIDVDGQLSAYLEEKRRLVQARLGDVFAAEPGTEAAQAEVLRLLVEHLPARFPKIYRRDGKALVIAGEMRRIELEGVEPPLLTAAALVQEDLVLMRKGEAGWRLAAAVLAFPSSWRLADKFSRPMHEIHAPVPGFGKGTRPNELITRMFDHLRPEMPVIRWNWSLYGDVRLFHPETSPSDLPRFGANAEAAFIRVERQTLRRLPESGDILFTIRIYIDPLAELAKHQHAPAIAASLIGQLEEMTGEQAAYKGLVLERDKLIARLRRIATG